MNIVEPTIRVRVRHLRGKQARTTARHPSSVTAEEPDAARRIACL
jgi:hypothetical protein